MDRYTSPLRSLAREVAQVVQRHKAYSQVISLFQHVDEYLNGRAYIEEVHQRTLRSEIQLLNEGELSLDAVLKIEQAIGAWREKRAGLDRARVEAARAADDEAHAAARRAEERESDRELAAIRGDDMQTSGGHQIPPLKNYRAGNPDPYDIGDMVMKRKGVSYGGPGVIVARFNGLDSTLHYIVGHMIDGGEGHFYHIYTPSQLHLL